MRSFLSYWKPETLEVNRDGRVLDHIASNQYGKLSIDDEVFVVTAKKGILLLIGKVIVGRIIDHATAERIVGCKLWESSFHVLCKPRTASPIRELDISELADKIRFRSERDRLKVKDGSIDPRQLQTMRELTPQSAAHLDAAIQNSAGMIRK